MGMHKFDLSDRFRLELHWSDILYNIDGVCDFTDAYFSGPALSEAVKLNDEDFIYLDFYRQYISLVRSVYVVKFSWRGVKYEKDGIIKFDNSKMEHATELNRVPKLKKNDYIIIDTSDHEDEKHQYNLLYKTYVVNEDTQLYAFEG
jgi:hypothetical protein